MKLKISICTIVLTFNIFLNADNRIVFYLQDPPPQAIELAEMDVTKEKGLKKLSKIDQKTPGQISRKLVKYQMKQHLTPKLGGFMSFYSGYLDYSNDNGLIAFPLRHTEPKLYLVITPHFKLVKSKGETISHLEFGDKKTAPSQIYLFEKKVDKNKQFFWKVSEQEMPEDNIINPISVILLTKPKNIYIAKGDFISNDSKHIVLPENIYVVGTIGNNKALLNSVDIKRFFEPIELEEQNVNSLISKKMIINN